MQKEQVLEIVEKAASEKAVSRAEVISAFDRGAGIDSMIESKFKKTFNISRILYYIGAAIVFMGIIFLVFQNWSDFSTLTRIIITLGSSIAAYVIGLALMREEKFKVVAQAFFLISLLLLPLGLAVALHEMDIEVGRASTQIIISLVSLAVAVSSFIIYKKNVFVVFCVGFATWLFYSLITAMFISSNISFDIYAYLTMVVGISYILLGYSFSKTERFPLTGPLYSFGLLAFYGAAISRGGAWDVIFPGFVFLALIMSVFLKSRAFVTFSTIFLMSYLIKITARYFADSLGWPVSLVIAGLLLIMIGYLAVKFSRKYLAPNEAVRS